MPVAEYCQRDVRTVGGSATLAEAATRMKEEDVGCLVVVGDDARPWGMVTDRDLALRSLRGRLDPRTATLDAVVPRDQLVLVREQSPVRIAIAMMRKHGVRRLPVVDAGGQLVGLLAWDDVLELLAQELSGVAAVVRGQASRAGVPRARALEEVLGEAQ